MRDIRDGVTFINDDGEYRHTYRDWGLYISLRDVQAPEPQLHTVEIPGRDGVVDLTETLDGYVHYYNREVEMEFRFITRDDWNLRYREIANFLHGKYMKIIFDDDPDKYFYGRCTLEEFTLEAGDPGGFFTVVADCEPYKTFLTPYEYKIPISDIDDGDTTSLDLTEMWDRVYTSISSNEVRSKEHHYSCGLSDGEDTVCSAFNSIHFKYVYTKTDDDGTAHTCTAILSIKDTDGNYISLKPEEEQTSWSVTISSKLSNTYGLSITSSADYKVNSHSDDAIDFDKIYYVGFLMQMVNKDPKYVTVTITADVDACLRVDLKGVENHAIPTIWNSSGVEVIAGKHRYDLELDENVLYDTPIDRDGTTIYLFHESGVSIYEKYEYIEYTGGCL